MFKKLLILILLFISSNAYSENLTLEEVIKLNEANNPNLKVIDWDNKIAKDNIKLSKSSLYPKVDAQAAYTVQVRPQAISVMGRTAETQQANFGSAALAASYTIYDFGRRSAKIEEAKYLAEATSLLNDARRKDSDIQVIEAYFGIIELDHLIEASQQEIVQVESHRKNAKTLYEEGVATRNDVLQADVRLSFSRQKLVSLENRNKNLWLRLNYLIGKPENYRATLNPKYEVETPDENIEISNREEIKALKQSVLASESEIKTVNSLYYPEFFVKTGVDYMENNKVREQAILYGVIGFKINLFDGLSTTAQKEMAINSRAKKLETLKQLEAELKVEASMYRNDIKVAKEKISLALSALKQSKENLRINQERYKERVGTATEVLDAQTLNTQSKSEYFSALYEYQISLARYKRAKGLL